MSTVSILSPVFAQAETTPAAPAAKTAAANDDMTVIVVTARKRAENVQSVPIAITAITGNALAAKGITNVLDLRGNVPSLSTEATGGPNSAFPNFGIRGQRSDSYFILQAPTVVTYFADAPQGHPVGFGSSLYDLASVQVLKGPQGTLFGVNATGGAIIVQPNKPSSKLEGAVNTSIGNFGDVVVGGMVNLPISDNAAIRVAGQYHVNNGWMKNITTGSELAKDDNLSLRPSLLLKSSDDSITSLTTIDYYRDKGAPIGNVLTYVNTGASLLAAQPAAFAEAKAALARAQARTGDDRWSIEGQANTHTAGDVLGRPEQQYILNQGITNDTSFALGENAKIRNILSYREIDANVDVYFSPVPIYLISLANYRQKSQQVSEELQLTGKAFSGRMDYVLGAYYRRENGFDDAPSALVNGARLQNSGGGVTTNKSLFAQASYKVTSNLTATLGLRYNDDKIYGYSDSKVLTGTSPLIPRESRTPLVCNVGTLSSTATLVRFPLSACSLDGTVAFKKTTYLASLEYHLADGILPGAKGTLVYATMRTGYRAGGFNVRATAYPLFGPYRPEAITDYETGLKSDWHIADTRLRTNIALFFDKLNDLQRSVSVPVPGSPQPLSTVTNAAKSTVYGLEAEFTFIPFQNLEFSGYYNYLNNKYDSYISTSSTGLPIDLSGRPFRASPQNKYALTGRYTVPLANDATVVISANYAWQDVEKLAETPDSAGNLYTQPAYGLLNSRIDWNNIGGSNISAGLWVRNATNKFYATGYSDLSSSLGVSVITPGEPRSYGVDLRAKF